ncbi:MAG: BamA/TamA family outer membrane protein, partial [Pirellulales bacterium]
MIRRHRLLRHAVARVCLALWSVTGLLAAEAATAEDSSDRPSRADAPSRLWRTKASSARRETANPRFRAQSPGYDSESAITGGAPPASAQGYYGPANQAGQMPMRRTGPDAPAGFGSGRYPSAGYGGGNAVNQPVQYSPNQPPGQSGPYGPPGSVSGGFGAGVAPPNYYQGGYQPGQFAPGGAPAQPYQPGTPFAQPGASGPGAGMIGPQGPRPNVVPPPNSIPGYGAPPNGPFMNGAGPPPLGGYGSQGEMFSPDSPFNEPPLFVPIQVNVQETQTGRLMFGAGVNSNAGLIGNIVIDEQNFDWRRIPTSWEDIRNATAFRGAGQQFRIEAYPGTLLSRYGFTFREPYLWDTRINFGLDGYYFNRYYQNWTEQRVGGRMSFGYMLTPDLSTSLA